MPLSADKTIGEIAAEFPAAARVLEKHHIDYYSERSQRRRRCRVAGVSAEWRCWRKCDALLRDAAQVLNALPVADLIQYLVKYRISAG